MKQHTCNDHVETKKNPWQVHGLELGAKPEVDNGVLVQLAPHIQDGHHHRVHQEGDGQTKSHDHSKQPVEQEHEQIVCRTAIKYSSFEPQTKKEC